MVQAEKTILRTGNSLCRGGKREHDVSLGGKASNIAEVEIPVRMEQGDGRMIKR
jgi:hypothetical protein